MSFFSVPLAKLIPICLTAAVECSKISWWVCLVWPAVIWEITMSWRLAVWFEIPESVKLRVEAKVGVGRRAGKPDALPWSCSVSVRQLFWLHTLANLYRVAIMPNGRYWSRNRAFSRYSISAWFASFKVSRYSALAQQILVWRDPWNPSKSVDVDEHRALIQYCTCSVYLEQFIKTWPTIWRPQITCPRKRIR